MDNVTKRADRRDVVAVEGSAAGVTAAVTVRRHDPDKQVPILRKAEQAPIPCGIPYLCGTLGNPEKNLIPDALRSTPAQGGLKHADLRV
jgi:NADH oxidase (H2O2-forming)